MFYDKLVALCRDRGESVTKACNNAGIASTQVTRWKNSGTFPTNQALHKLCNYFDVPLDYFDTDHPTPAGVDDVPLFSDDETGSLSLSAELLQDLAHTPNLLALIRRLKAYDYADVEALMAVLEALHK